MALEVVQRLNVWQLGSKSAIAVQKPHIGRLGIAATIVVQGSCLIVRLHGYDSNARTMFVSGYHSTKIIYVLIIKAPCL